MTRAARDDRALRREALATRASLQRMQIAATVGRARRGMTSKGAGALALRLARSAFAGRAAAPAATAARPLLLSAGWMAVRALRASPTARWIAGAIAVGGAVWWIARSLRAGDEERVGDGSDDQGRSADDSG